MDFGDFHEAIEKVLGRPVWTHEFARPQILRDEFEKKIPKQMVKDSIKLLEELTNGKPIIHLMGRGRNGE